MTSGGPVADRPAVFVRTAGLDVDSAIENGSTGAGSISLVDPDGNPILIDQFF